MVLVQPPRKIYHDETDAWYVTDVDASFVPVVRSIA